MVSRSPLQNVLTNASMPFVQARSSIADDAAFALADLAGYECQHPATALSFQQTSVLDQDDFDLLVSQYSNADPSRFLLAHSTHSYNSSPELYLWSPNFNSDGSFNVVQKWLYVSNLSSYGSSGQVGIVALRPRQGVTTLTYSQTRLDQLVTSGQVQSGNFSRQPSTITESTDLMPFQIESQARRIATSRISELPIHFPTSCPEDSVPVIVGESRVLSRSSPVVFRRELTINTDFVSTTVSDIDDFLRIVGPTRFTLTVRASFTSVQQGVFCSITFNSGTINKTSTNTDATTLINWAQQEDGNPVDTGYIEHTGSTLVTRNLQPTAFRVRTQVLNGIAEKVTLVMEKLAGTETQSKFPNLALLLVEDIDPVQRINLDVEARYQVDLASYITGFYPNFNYVLVSPERVYCAAAIADILRKHGMPAALSAQQVRAIREAHGRSYSASTLGDIIQAIMSAVRIVARGVVAAAPYAALLASTEREGNTGGTASARPSNLSGASSQPRTEFRASTVGSENYSFRGRGAPQQERGTARTQMSQFADVYDAFKTQMSTPALTQLVEPQVYNPALLNRVTPPPSIHTNSCWAKLGETIAASQRGSPVRPAMSPLANSQQARGVPEFEAPNTVERATPESEASVPVRQESVALVPARQISTASPALTHRLETPRPASEVDYADELRKWYLKHRAIERDEFSVLKNESDMVLLAEQYVEFFKSDYGIDHCSYILRHSYKFATQFEEGVRDLRSLPSKYHVLLVFLAVSFIEGQNECPIRIRAVEKYKEEQRLQEIEAHGNHHNELASSQSEDLQESLGDYSQTEIDVENDVDAGASQGAMEGVELTEDPGVLLQDVRVSLEPVQTPPDSVTLQLLDESLQLREQIERDGPGSEFVNSNLLDHLLRLSAASKTPQPVEFCCATQGAVSYSTRPRGPVTAIQPSAVVRALRQENNDPKNFIRTRDCLVVMRMSDGKEHPLRCLVTISAKQPTTMLNYQLYKAPVPFYSNVRAAFNEMRPDMQSVLGPMIDMADALREMLRDPPYLTVVAQYNEQDIEDFSTQQLSGHSYSLALSAAFFGLPGQLEGRQIFYVGSSTSGMGFGPSASLNVDDFVTKTGFLKNTDLLIVMTQRQNLDEIAERIGHKNAGIFGREPLIEAGQSFRKGCLRVAISTFDLMCIEEFFMPIAQTAYPKLLSVAPGSAEVSQYQETIREMAEQLESERSRAGQLSDALRSSQFAEPVKLEQENKELRLQLAMAQEALMASQRERQTGLRSLRSGQDDNQVVNDVLNGMSQYGGGPGIRNVKGLVLGQRSAEVVMGERQISYNALPLSQVCDTSALKMDPVEIEHRFNETCTILRQAVAIHATFNEVRKGLEDQGYNRQQGTASLDGLDLQKYHAARAVYNKEMLKLNLQFAADSLAVLAVHTCVTQYWELIQKYFPERVTAQFQKLLNNLIGENVANSISNEQVRKSYPILWAEAQKFPLLFTAVTNVLAIQRSVAQFNSHIDVATDATKASPDGPNTFAGVVAMMVRTYNAIRPVRDGEAYLSQAQSSVNLARYESVTQPYRRMLNDNSQSRETHPPSRFVPSGYTEQQWDSAIATACWLIPLYFTCAYVRVAKISSDVGNTIMKGTKTASKSQRRVVSSHSKDIFASLLTQLNEVRTSAPPSKSPGKSVSFNSQVAVKTVPRQKTQTPPTKTGAGLLSFANFARTNPGPQRVTQSPAAAEDYDREDVEIEEDDIEDENTQLRPQASAITNDEEDEDLPERW